MGHIQSRFFRRNRISQEIPTGPMADISFLLIIFFMVTTVFVVYRGFPVDLPTAEKIDAMRGKRNVVNIWISPQGRIMVDQFDTQIPQMGNIIKTKLAANPRVVVLVRSDRNTPFRMISGVIEELKKENALRVSFIAQAKK
jgi:biopolymer transport protein ExbD